MNNSRSYNQSYDAITAEALARTTADGVQTQLFLIMDAITAENFS
jgi:hypothetical protein